MIKSSCPVCGREMAGRGRDEWPEFPFCSVRCKTIDLGRWLGERYRIPAEEADPPSAEEADTP
jgi:endogenous inhibitor of DNA gyrase (YacG/DUF329 family)